MPKLDVRLHSSTGTTGVVSALVDSGASFTLLASSVATAAGIVPVNDVVHRFAGLGGGQSVQEARCAIELLGPTGAPLERFDDCRVFVVLETERLPHGVFALLGQDGFMDKITYWQHHRAPQSQDRHFGVKRRA